MLGLGLRVGLEQFFERRSGDRIKSRVRVKLRERVSRRVSVRRRVGVMLRTRVKLLAVGVALILGTGCNGL